MYLLKSLMVPFDLADLLLVSWLGKLCHFQGPWQLCFHMKGLQNMCWIFEGCSACVKTALHSRRCLVLFGLQVALAELWGVFWLHILLQFQFLFHQDASRRMFFFSLESVCCRCQAPDYFKKKKKKVVKQCMKQNLFSNPCSWKVLWNMLQMVTNWCDLL